MTHYLSQFSQDVTVVEGAEPFCNQLRSKYPHIHIVHALFEEYNAERAFENIILGHVLEHVEEPSFILRRVKDWLSPEGRIFAAVPNAHSLHRQAAVIMGLLESEKDLSENDVYQGHRRTYDPKTFRAEFIAAGLKIELFSGYWIKPLSESQIVEHWTEEMVSTFMELGEHYPDIAAQIYVIAKN